MFVCQSSFFTDCLNAGETVQNGVCTCANVGETVQNGACTCANIGEIVQNGTCTCPAEKILNNGACIGRSPLFFITKMKKTKSEAIEALHF